MKKLIVTILLGMVGGGLLFLLTVRLMLINHEELRAEPAVVEKELQNGDIIFQTSKSSQSKAIQLATGSRYSHMGILYNIDGQFFVYEAAQPVKLTRFVDWIKRGERYHYVVKRLRNSQDVLTEENLKKMKAAGEKFKGKDYDIYFGWTNDKIYCSELVWKIYKEALNIELGELQELKEFDLSSEVVRSTMKDRYGNYIPYWEKVISPAAMFESDKLETVITQ